MTKSCSTCPIEMSSSSRNCVSQQLLWFHPPMHVLEKDTSVMLWTQRVVKLWKSAPLRSHGVIVEVPTAQRTMSDILQTASVVQGSNQPMTRAVVGIASKSGPRWSER